VMRCLELHGFAACITPKLHTASRRASCAQVVDLLRIAVGKAGRDRMDLVERELQCFTPLCDPPPELRQASKPLKVRAGEGGCVCTQRCLADVRAKVGIDQGALAFRVLLPAGFWREAFEDHPVYFPQRPSTD